MVAKVIGMMQKLTHCFNFMRGEVTPVRKWTINRQVR